MADGEWRMDDLIRFLYATLGDTSAFLKLNPDYRFLRALGVLCGKAFRFLGVLSTLCGSALTLISVYLRLSAANKAGYAVSIHVSRFTIRDLRFTGVWSTHHSPLTILDP